MYIVSNIIEMLYYFQLYTVFKPLKIIECNQLILIILL